MPYSEVTLSEYTLVRALEWKRFSSCQDSFLLMVRHNVTMSVVLEDVQNSLSSVSQVFHTASHVVFQQMSWI